MSRPTTSQAPPIGIDLGTTFSLVGYFREGFGVQVVADDQEARNIPSYATYFRDEDELSSSSEEWVFGQVAGDDGLRSPENWIFDTKRMLGYAYDMPTVSTLGVNWPFSLEKGPKGEIFIKVEESDGIRRYQPYQISGKILSFLKKRVESIVGPVQEAVITVPANFNDAQRSETIKAAEEAGLKVLRLVNEPTAAGLAYVWEVKPQGHRTILIFDLGGGTLDVSLMEIEVAVSEGKEKVQFEVKAVDGDPHLGGRDFDERIFKFCLSSVDSKVAQKFRVDPSLRDKNRTLWRETWIKRQKLLMKCEKAKRNLTKDSYPIKVESGSIVRISRSKFEEICQDLFERLLIPVKRILDLNGKRPNEIQHIILVGGATLMPKVKVMLSNLFPQILEPQRVLDPIEAVVKGATIMAAKLKGHKGVSTLEGFEVCNANIGIKAIGDYMTPVIRHGERLPARALYACSLAEHNQTSGRIEVYEGPCHVASSNRPLGNFTISNVPRADAGFESIVLEFCLDEDGTLSVSGFVVSDATGERTELVVAKSGHLLKGDSLDVLYRKASDLAIAEKNHREARISFYEFNVRSFLEAEPGKNSLFSRLINGTKVQDLRKFLQDRVPSRLGRGLEETEFQSVKQHVADALKPYFDQTIGRIPGWIFEKRPFDVVYMVDATGSMASTIQSARDQCVAISQQLSLQLKDFEFQFGAVFYRDPVDSAGDRHETFLLTYNVERLRSDIAKVKAYGGGDTPEDWVGAYELSLNKINWRGGQRLIIHLADAPAHGEYYCGSRNHEEEKEKLAPLIKRCAARQIKIVGMPINDSATERCFNRCKKHYDEAKGPLYMVRPYGSSLTSSEEFKRAIVNDVVAAAPRQ